MRFEYGGNLSLVTLTFDLDIQTPPSESVCVFVCVSMFLSACYYCFLLIVVFIYSAL